MTVGNCQYYVHVQECRLNGIENAVVILSFPKGAFGNLKALRCFVCTDVSLNVETIPRTQGGGRSRCFSVKAKTNLL